MLTTPSNITGLSLKPLGSGDLIDRAIRFYRKNFWTFLTISAPPVLVGTMLMIGWTFVAGLLFNVDVSRPDEATLYQFFIGLGSFLIWLVQLIAVLAVMGGASRNFVRHLLFDEPITFRETYRNTRKRLPGLLFVSFLVAFLMLIVGVIVFYAWIIVLSLSVILASIVGQLISVVGFILGVVLGLVITLAALWLFFAALSRFVYVPQIMLVEGLGAMPALGRSMTLAGKNVTRVGSLFVFTLISIYVVLTLLYLPLWFVAWSQGVDLTGASFYDVTPAWYEIASQAVTQSSLILMLPVLVVGLCLLYVDERVRSEGYDLELMAAKTLGEIPNVPAEFVNPLQPALSSAEPSPIAGSSGNGTTLGL